MARTHTFKGSATAGYGYFAFIEDGQLVIGEDWGREGGVYFRGFYTEAVANGHMNSLKTEDPVLYNDIEKYFIKHGVISDEQEALKKKYGFDEETKTVLFKVKLYMDDGHTVHSVLVRGRYQADVIKKLFPTVAEVLTLQTYNANVFAVRSEKISAAEFVED